MLASPVAYPTPQPVAKSAIKPVSVRLKADRVHKCTVHTERCLGCGRRCDEPAKSVVFWQAGLGTTLRRAFLVFLFMAFGPSGCMVLAVLLDKIGLPQPVGPLVAAGLVMWLAVVLHRAFVPHVKTGLVRCRACRWQETLGQLLVAGVSVVAIATPVIALSWYAARGWGPRTPGMILLLASSGMLVALWLSPLFRAGNRPRPIARRINKQELVLEVSPTFHQVLRAEQPAAFVAAEASAPISG